jgi:hypothetical protein
MGFSIQNSQNLEEFEIQKAYMHKIFSFALYARGNG